MPFDVRRQDCTDSEGRSGLYVVFNSDTGDSVSCHATRDKAEAAARIRQEESDKNEYIDTRSLADKIGLVVWVLHSLLITSSPFNALVAFSPPSL